MSAKFYIKDDNGIFLSTDGKTKYICLEGTALYDFLNSEEGKNRTFYVDIDENGDKIGIETEPKMVTACNEQRERDRYRNKVKAQLNITIISGNTMVSIPGEDEIELVETLVDEDADVEADVMHNIDLEIMRKALQTLTREEYHLIYHLYLSKNPVTERKYAEIRGLHYMTVHNRKTAILKKLKNFF